ncbi:MAG: hypothetical protein O9256_02395 [Rhizobiaceae bacterium]|nr:hypothetical protein [Rhizobiaceae bacterium]MCZ8352965.1 hypothetical protein [Rhizobium sp.]
MHMQMIEPIPELAGIDPASSLPPLVPALRIAVELVQMDEHELMAMAGRFEGDPASGVTMIDELADARRYVSALAGVLESAELRLLSALS